MSNIDNPTKWASEQPTSKLRAIAQAAILELSARDKVEVYLGLIDMACVQAEVVDAFDNGPVLQINARVFHPERGDISKLTHEG